MTVKELKNEYDYVVKTNNQYHVHVEGGKRNVYKYLASVNKKGKSMYVTGFNPTTKLNVLKKQIESFSKSLPYDSEYYSPLYRKGYKEEIIIHDYLESINFKDNLGEFYTYNKKSIYGYNTTNIRLSISGLDSLNEVKDNVTVNLWTGNYEWVSSNCKRNVEDIIKTIDTLLKPLLLTESVSNIETSEKLESIGNIDVILKQLSGLDIKETNIKKYLKNKLLEITNAL